MSDDGLEKLAADAQRTSLELLGERDDLKRKLSELEGELITAYMTGYHKRDDEVRELRAHADALAGALEDLLKEQNGAPLLRRKREWIFAHDQAQAALKAYRNREE